MRGWVAAIGLSLCLCCAAAAGGKDRARGLRDADGTIGPIVFPMTFHLKAYEPIFGLSNLVFVDGVAPMVDLGQPAEVVAGDEGFQTNAFVLTFKNISST